MLSNSGHDERNKYNGGAAGDQTGGEWALISWYNRPWKCVLRHSDPIVRAKLAALARAAAQNNKIGYDQSGRDTFWSQLVKVGYDPAKITVDCEADCSSGVIALTKATGHLLNIVALKNINATYTGNMRAGFKAAGFEVLTASKYLTSDAYLLEGDILLNDGAHTAINLDNGSKSGSTGNSTTNSGSTATKIEAAKYKDDSAAKGKKLKTTSALYIRKGAGKSKEAIDVLPKGTTVTWYGYYNKVSEVKWYLVIDHKGRTGYCSSAYLS